MRAPAAGLVLALLAPACALAEGKSAVAVVPGEEPDDRTVVAAVWAIRKAVDAQSDLTTVSIDERLGEVHGDAVAEGRAALQDGRQAFGELDIERAGRSLEAAARLLAPLADHRDDAIEALDLLAQTRAASKDELGAAVAYARLMKLDPDFEPDAEALGPTVTKAWKRARNLDKAGKPGPLRIESSMAPAAVFIGGEFVGVTPQLIRKPAGVALDVTLRADGFAPWVRTLALRPGTSAAIEPALEPLGKSPLLLDIIEKLPGQFERETMTTPLKDLRSLLFADQAIIVGLEGGDLQVQLYDLKVGRRVRAVRYPLRPQGVGTEDGVAIVESLYSGVDAFAPGTTELAEEEPESLDGGGRHLMDAWWFWPAVGVAAATAVALPIVLLSGDDDPALNGKDGTGAVILRF